MGGPDLPPREDEGKPEPTSIRIGDKLLARLDAIAAARGYSRSEAILAIIRWGVRELEKEQPKKR